MNRNNGTNSFYKAKLFKKINKFFSIQKNYSKKLTNFSKIIENQAKILENVNRNNGFNVNRNNGTNSFYKAKPHYFKYELSLKLRDICFSKQPNNRRRNWVEPRVVKNLKRCSIILT